MEESAGPLVFLARAFFMGSLKVGFAKHDLDSPMTLLRILPSKSSQQMPDVCGASSGVTAVTS